MGISAVKKVFLFDQFENLQMRGKKMHQKQDKPNDRFELSEKAKKLRSENFLPSQVRFSRSQSSEQKKTAENKDGNGGQNGTQEKQTRIVSRYAVGAE